MAITFILMKLKWHQVKFPIQIIFHSHTKYQLKRVNNIVLQ